MMNYSSIISDLQKSCPEKKYIFLKVYKDFGTIYS